MWFSPHIFSQLTTSNFGFFNVCCCACLSRFLYAELKQDLAHVQREANKKQVLSIYAPSLADKLQVTNLGILKGA